MNLNNNLLIEDSFQKRKMPFFLKIYLFIVIVLLTGGANIIDNNQLVTLVLLPVLAIYFFFNYGLNFNKWSIELYLVLILFVSSFISLFFSKDIDVGINEIKMLFGVFLLGFIFFYLNIYERYYEVVLWGIFTSSILLIVELIFQGEIILNLEFIKNYRDRSGFLLNANAYSYSIFFANLSLFYLLNIYKSKLFLIIVLLSQYLFIVTIFITASRAGLLLFLLLNFFYWFFVEKSKKLYIKILKLFLLIVMVLYGSATLFENSYLSTRTEINVVKEDTRITLINEGIDIFTNNPFFGVGPGQTIFYIKTGHYTHNSYIEVASTQGIIGFIILVLILFIPLKKLLNKDRSNIFTKLNIMFMLLFIIYNNFYPFYKYIDLMIFYFLVVNSINETENKYNT